MTWRVRAAGAADADALSLIASAAFLETYAASLDGADLVAHCIAHNSPTTFAAWANDPSTVIALGELEPRHVSVGYTVLTSVDLPIEPQHGDIELRRIYLLTQMHGTGLGPALMARALEDAARLGKRRMLLGVWGENHRAHRFYERQGFAAVGTRRFQVGAEVHDDLVYARSI